MGHPGSRESSFLRRLQWSWLESEIHFASLFGGTMAVLVCQALFESARREGAWGTAFLFGVPLFGVTWLCFKVAFHTLPTVKGWRELEPSVRVAIGALLSVAYVLYFAVLQNLLGFSQ